MKIAIAGGGAIGRYVAEDLAQNGHTILVIEKNEAVITRNFLPQNASWLFADACEIGSLHGKNLESCDVYVAVTGDDEDNLVASLLARQEFGIPRVIARVNHPRNAWLFNESWGIDNAVSVPHMITGLVEEAVSSGQLVELLQLVGGKAGLVEVTLSSSSPALGKTVGDLDFPRNANLVAIARNRSVVFPRSDTLLSEGDEVLILITPESEDNIRAIFIAAE